MIFLYRFESSKRVRSVKMPETEMEVSEVVDAILKSLFKDKEPTCSLQLLDSTAALLIIKNLKPDGLTKESPIFKYIFFTMFYTMFILRIT